MAMLRRLIHWLSSAIYAEGLDTTEYVEHIEREFGIVIGNEHMGTLATLGDLCAYISAQRGERGQPLDEEVIWQTVRRITSDDFGIDATELHRGIRYVEDLCC